MVPSILRAGRVTATVVLAIFASGCCSMLDDEGCKSDKDCKGDRICVAGECSEPSPGAPPGPQNPNVQPPRVLVPEPQPPPAAQPPTPVRTISPPTQPAQPAPPTKPAQPACTDYYCTTGKGTIGMCKSGVCTDPCGPGTGFDPTDTQCHKMCKSNSQCVAPDKCNGGICVPW